MAFFDSDRPTGSNYIENKLIDHILRSATFAKPTMVYIALCATEPDDAGGGTEFAGGNYARAAYNVGDTYWTATQGGTSGVSSGTEGVSYNVFDITYPTPTADWGVPIAFKIMDAASGGNMLAWGRLYDVRFREQEEQVPPPEIKAGDPAPVLLAGAVGVRIS